MVVNNDGRFLLFLDQWVYSKMIEQVSNDQFVDGRFIFLLLFVDDFESRFLKSNNDLDNKIYRTRNLPFRRRQNG